LEKYVSDVPKKLESLINEYWPGPLTILFDKNSIIPNEVNAGLKKVAVRMPNHETTLELIESLNIPLAAPSANPFGYISPTRADHVQEQLGDKIPYILDGGPSKIGLESTIIGLEGDLLVVYRLGGITLENLMLHYGGIVTVQNHKEDNQDAPGMLPYHYAPKTELILSQDLSLLSFNSDKIGLIHHSTFQPSPSIEHSIFLDSTDDYTQAGRLLYESLYHMDKLGLDLIIVEKFPETGLGRTINDRMIRAAYRRK
ncbi:MAG: L-threonylcarbamoyladenylate synthase, partial [Saprospiraceae bacterium]